MEVGHQELRGTDRTGRKRTVQVKTHSRSKDSSLNNMGFLL